MSRFLARRLGKEERCPVFKLLWKACIGHDPEGTVDTACPELLAWHWKAVRLPHLPARHPAACGVGSRSPHGLHTNTGRKESNAARAATPEALPCTPCTSHLWMPTQGTKTHGRGLKHLCLKEPFAKKTREQTL